MHLLTRGFALSVLVACGVDDARFIPEYTDLYCQAFMECTDPAVLQFDGIASKDDCLAIVGPEVADEVGRCAYSRKHARRCLKAMEGMPCPGPDQSLDDVLPADCAEVSTACAAPKEPAEETGGGSGV